MIVPFFERSSPSMDITAINEIITEIQRSNHILLTAHHKLDPDSTGGILALYLICKKLGKQPVALCYEPIPKNLEFLPHINAIDHDKKLMQDFIITLFNPESEVNEIKYSTTAEGYINIIITPKRGTYSEQDVTFKGMSNKFDLIIVVDSGDKKNMGRLYEDNKEIFESTTVVNIDHHASNDYFGDINLVDTTVSSASELVYYIIEHMDPGLIDEDVATYLLLGIIADTGSFQHSNTTPDSLKVAAELVRRGARQQDIIKNLYKTKKFSTLKLWGKALARLQVDNESRMLWSSLTYAELSQMQAKPEDTKGVIDELMSSAPNVDFIVLLTEIAPGTVSASIRTKSKEVNGTVIAKQFGGGGHIEACGFTLENTDLADVERRVIDAIRVYQADRLGAPKPVQEVSTYEKQPAPQPTYVTEERIAQKLEDDLFKS